MQGPDQGGPSLLRLDDVVEKPPFRRHVRIGELLLVVLNQLLGFLCRLLGRSDFPLEDDVDGSLGTHNGDLGRRPGVIEITADVFGRHHVVGAAIRFARDHREFGHRGLCKGIQQLRAVPDDAVVLLRRPG